MFQNRNNEQEYVWATSWGVSTRLVGAIVMTHSDDAGLVLPPKLAPTQAVVVPILRKDGSPEVVEAAEQITNELKDAGVRVKLDARDSQRPGWKFTQYEIEGVPVRIALGPRDLENGSVEIARRDTREKEIVPRDGLAEHVGTLLTDIQQNLFETALAFRNEHTFRVDSYDDFKETLDSKGGFILAHWDGSAETEAQIKEETKATIRCIPIVGESEDGVDMISGKPSRKRVVFGRAY